MHFLDDGIVGGDVLSVQRRARFTAADIELTSNLPKCEVVAVGSVPATALQAVCSRTSISRARPSALTISRTRTPSSVPLRQPPCWRFWRGLKTHRSAFGSCAPAVANYSFGHLRQPRARVFWWADWLASNTDAVGTGFSPG